MHRNWSEHWGSSKNKKPSDCHEVLKYVFSLITQGWNKALSTLMVVSLPSSSCPLWITRLWDGFGEDAAAEIDHWVSEFICTFLKCGAQATMQLSTQTAKFSFWIQYISLGLTSILKTSTKYTIWMYNLLICHRHWYQVYLI